MATSSFFNRIIANAVSGGTADFVLSSALAGYRAPSGNVPNGAIVSYTAESSDKLQWETGQGAHNAGTVQRTLVRENSLGTTALINFSVPPIVRIDCHAQDIVQILQGLVTNQFDKINDTNFSDVPGLSLSLLAGVKYRGRATLYTTMQGTPGGMKVGSAFTGTVNAYRAHALPIIGNTTPGNGGMTTSLGVQITSGFSAFTQIEISFFIDVLTAGNLTITWAQGSQSNTASSVFVGSNITATAIG